MTSSATPAKPAPRRLEDAAYDVVVIGGGIAGAGAARDLVLRGLSVAIVGKPSPIILEVALASLGVSAADAVIVGDRLETDITMGKRLGLATVLVLSGVTRADDLRIHAIAPDLVLGAVAELLVD